MALTKADLADDEAAAVSEIRQRLQDTAFADAPIVPTSVVTGRGLDALKSTLARELSVAPPSRDIGKPRLAVDRVFTLAGNRNGGDRDARRRHAAAGPVGRHSTGRAIRRASAESSRTVVMSRQADPAPVRR